MNYDTAIELDYFEQGSYCACIAINDYTIDQRRELLYIYLTKMTNVPLYVMLIIVTLSDVIYKHSDCH